MKGISKEVLVGDLRGEGERERGSERTEWNKAPFFLMLLSLRFTPKIYTSYSAYVSSSIVLHRTGISACCACCALAVLQLFLFHMSANQIPHLHISSTSSVIRSRQSDAGIHSQPHSRIQCILWKVGSIFTCQDWLHCTRGASLAEGCKNSQT